MSHLPGTQTTEIQYHMPVYNLTGYSIADTFGTLNWGQTSGSFVHDDSSSVFAVDVNDDDAILDDDNGLGLGADPNQLIDGTSTHINTGGMWTLQVTGPLGENFGTINMVRTLFGVGDKLLFSEDLIDGATYSIIAYDGNGELAYADIATQTAIPCLTSSTQIETDRGRVLAGKLKAGDYVRTADNGYKPVRLVLSTMVSPADLNKNHKLHPVRIIAGALGGGLPERDLLVSPQHRVLVSSRISERMTGQRETLVSANKLTELPGVFVDDDVCEVEYIHILFDQHEVIYAEGAPLESLYCGPEALKAVSPSARAEILTLFPELNVRGFLPTPVRSILTGRQQKRLIARHCKNNKPVLSLHWY